jgi:hypothetical protein
VRWRPGASILCCGGGCNAPSRYYVLDLYGNVRQNGQPVDIAPSNGTGAQLWDLVPIAGGVISPSFYAEIQLRGSSPAMCLDKPNGSDADGTKLQIWECNGQDQQLWTAGYLVGQPELALVNKQLGKYLDAPNVNFNNPQVWVWDCWGGMNQAWIER